MVARLSEAPSFPAQGLLGPVGGWGALNHGCLRRRVGSPLPSPWGGRGGHASGRLPHAPLQTHKSAPSLPHWFISIPHSPPVK